MTYSKKMIYLLWKHETLYQKYELFKEECQIQKSTMRKAGKRHARVRSATAAPGLARGTFGPIILIYIYKNVYTIK